MNLIKYLINSRWKIVYFIMILLIIDTILAVSSTLNQSINDILYLDLLLFIFSLIFFFWGYLSWKNSYKDYVKAIEKNHNLEHIIPSGNSFEIQLIKDLIEFKNKELEKETKGLQYSLKEINEYITMWVHEIKIPISVCELISDRLQDGIPSDEVSSTSRDIQMELERIKFLIDQILYASRASNYSEDLFIEEINLENIIKPTIKKNASFFISKNISIDIHNTNFHVMTDKKWISYILQQLFNNSYKYLHNNGKIEVYAKEDDKSIKLMIKDNGIGIQRKDINRIFDKGFTGDNGRHHAKSTGMGLYYSKTMIDKLGHEIFVNSVPNSFTEFTIVFYKLSDYLNVTEM
ncbi:sensor histidine kinase [Sporosalibacterium faouarense]|uniref:sensor histidine kinase n=1 Tax=Sporosalibacterium faouarense TaxID=516123 RepID=UPI00192B5553|nr:sensor histidine kinase [Sporosalibacterium faouarense]